MPPRTMAARSGRPAGSPPSSRGPRSVPALGSGPSPAPANAAVVTLRNDLKTLQAENVTLSARYEQVFDMERIQAAVGDTMVRPTEEQIVYLDLSEPDSVVLYGEEETASGVRGALQGLKNIVRELTEYFR